MLDKYRDYNLVVYDKLTYAGNLDNLRGVADDPRYHFVKGDICDAERVADTIHRYAIDTIINFAAETHVDRSIMDPDAFIQTSVYGTYVCWRPRASSTWRASTRFPPTKFTATSLPAIPAWKRTSWIRAALTPPAKPAPTCW
jgi:dTDP-D-glucose 4,6-dehydratase